MRLHTARYIKFSKACYVGFLWFPIKKRYRVQPVLLLQSSVKEDQCWKNTYILLLLLFYLFIFMLTLHFCLYDYCIHVSVDFI